LLVCGRWPSFLSFLAEENKGMLTIFHGNEFDASDGFPFSRVECVFPFPEADTADEGRDL